MDKHELLLLNFLSLFDVNKLPDLIWVDACDAETLDYCMYRLKERVTFYQMVDLLKMLLKE